MADEFGQRIQGLHLEGDAVVSTDRHPAIFGKDASGDYAYLSINSSGFLEVTGGTQYDVDDAAGATDTGTAALVVRDDTLSTLTPVDGDYVTMRTDSEGALWVTISGDVNVTATDLDIRDLDASQDNVAISDGTDTLAINADGSINVNAQLGAVDSVYSAGNANLVKDTATTVVTESPAADEFYGAVMVSGAGYCEWSLQFGTTASEAVIMQWWTTPSHPTEYVDLPDYLTVSSGETILVEATNREKAASPASDFTGYATLIRKT